MLLVGVVDGHRLVDVFQFACGAHRSVFLLANILRLAFSAHGRVFLFGAEAIALTLDFLRFALSARPCVFGSKR